MDAYTHTTLKYPAQNMTLCNTAILLEVMIPKGKLWIQTSLGLDNLGKLPTEEVWFMKSEEVWFMDQVI